jgi:hypothetical protein
MEEDTDWAEEERHFNRLSKVRELLNEAHLELNMAHSEQCLNFLIEDPEIKDHLLKFSNLISSDPINYSLNPIFTGITSIHNLIEQVADKLNRLSTPPTSPDKSISGSIHANTNYPPLPDTTTGNSNPTTPKPAYNTAAKNAQAKPTQPAKTGPKLPTNPKTAHHPTRMVVQFKPNGIPTEQRPDPSKIVGSINEALANNPQAKHMKVVAASFNNQGNLILSTRTDQTAEDLMKFQNSFAHILADISNRQEIIIREDKKWFKVQIDGVSTGFLSAMNGRIQHSAEDVHTELINCNPIYAKSNELIVAKPRWLRTEEELSTTLKSSLVFALTDESTARQLLNQRSLAAFGRHCTLRAFQDRPPVTQCRNCWSLNHTTHRCTETQRCRLCSALHDEKEHPQADPNNCQRCTTAREYGDTMETTTGGHCPHDVRCANCISNNLENTNHPADARRCPVRLEKYGTARENERRAQKSDNPWIKAKTKKPKPQGPSEQPRPTTGANPSQNRFNPISSPNMRPPATTHFCNPEPTIFNTPMQQ